MGKKKAKKPDYLGKFQEAVSKKMEKSKKPINAKSFKTKMFSRKMGK